MSPLWQILLAGAGTYLIRISGLLVLERAGGMSPVVERRLKLVVPAVLSAIVFDQLFVHQGSLVFQWEWWVGGVVSGLVGWKFRSIAFTMGSGLVAVWAAQFFF